MSEAKATQQETTMIEPIKLLAGSHADTAQTGQGCFMNVIAYLNGEAQITDQSECVCFVMRPMAIYANDLFNDEDRQKLLPFILRAVGSLTDDKVVIIERLRHVVAFAEKQSQFAKSATKSTKSAAAYALSAKSAADYAVAYAKFATDYAAESAKFADESDNWYETTRDDLLAMFDACFPQLTEPQAVHLERDKRLYEMADA